MAIISIKNSTLLSTAKGFAIQKATGAMPILPTPTFTSATTSSYTVSITGYDPQFTYTVSASVGSAVRTNGNVTVSGLSANQSSTLTVTAANSDATKGLSLSSAVAFLSLPATPTLSRSGGTTTTVTVAIGNYDAGLTYTVGASAGSATRSGNTITVTGLTQGQAVTVTATASNASGNSAQGSLATGAVPATPTISFASATTNSLTFTITNYNAAYTYSVSSSSGSASRSGSTITVTGLAENTSVTAFATATANGIASAQGSASGTTLELGEYVAIASTTVGVGGAASVIFSNIPQTYSHLEIRAISRSGTGSYDRMRLRMNGDSGYNYAYLFMRGMGSTTQYEANAGLNYMTMDNVIGNQTQINTYSFSNILITDYASSKIKTARSFAGYDNEGGGSVGVYSGTWSQTTAISSITVFLEFSSFLENTEISLYGINAP